MSVGETTKQWIWNFYHPGRELRRHVISVCLIGSTRTHSLRVRHRRRWFIQTYPSTASPLHRLQLRIYIGVTCKRNTQCIPSAHEVT